MGSAVRTEKEWSETYYDTPDLGLSGASVSVMKESSAPAYWKLAAHDTPGGPCELTTNEKELGEPLGRLLNGTAPTTAATADLKPFFTLKALTRAYLIRVSPSILPSFLVEGGIV